MLSTPVTVAEAARDLRVTINSQLLISTHVAASSRLCYFHLWQIQPVIRSLMTESTWTLEQAFIIFYLDLCNSLLYGTSDRLLQGLQSVKNAGARLITGARRYICINLILHELYWLQLCQQLFAAVTQSSSHQLQQLLPLKIEKHFSTRACPHNSSLSPLALFTRHWPVQSRCTLPRTAVS